MEEEFKLELLLGKIKYLFLTNFNFSDLVKLLYLHTQHTHARTRTHTHTHFCSLMSLTF